MEEYQVVPKMISGKDLDYLSDMFEWNIGAIKKTNCALEQVKDETLKETLQKGYDLFQSNLETILGILKEGGCDE